MEHHKPEAKHQILGVTSFVGCRERSGEEECDAQKFERQERFVKAAQRKVAEFRGLNQWDNESIFVITQFC